MSVTRRTNALREKPEYMEGFDPLMRSSTSPEYYDTISRVREGWRRRRMV